MSSDSDNSDSYLIYDVSDESDEFLLRNLKEFYSDILIGELSSDSDIDLDIDSDIVIDSDIDSDTNISDMDILFMNIFSDEKYSISNFKDWIWKENVHIPKIKCFKMLPTIVKNQYMKYGLTPYEFIKEYNVNNEISNFILETPILFNDFEV